MPPASMAFRGSSVAGAADRPTYSVVGSSTDAFVQPTNIKAAKSREIFNVMSSISHSVLFDASSATGYNLITMRIETFRLLLSRALILMVACFAFAVKAADKNEVHDGANEKGAKIESQLLSQIQAAGFKKSDIGDVIHAPR